MSNALRKLSAPVLVVLSSIAISGCATVEPLGERSSAATPLPAEIAARFAYEAEPVSNSVTVRKEKRAYTIYDVILESGLDEFEDKSPITMEYYSLESEEAAPVILVLPILNGQKELLRPFASHFAKHGYAAVIVDTAQRQTLLEDLQHPEAAIRQTVLRHRRVLDWVETQPELDASRVGVFGASLGGFNAMYLAALDDRVRAVVPALVAGDIPYVMVNSNERRIERSVEAVKADLSLNDAEMQAYLEEKLLTDLLTLAPHVNNDRVLMVLAKRDKAVPYEKQLELREAMGQPEAIFLPSGHITAAAYIFYLRSRSRRFFDRKLGPADDRSVAVFAADPVE